MQEIREVVGMGRQGEDPKKDESRLKAHLCLHDVIPAKAGIQTTCPDIREPSLDSAFAGMTPGRLGKH